VVSRVPVAAGAVGSVSNPFGCQSRSCGGLVVGRVGCVVDFRCGGG